MTIIATQDNDIIISLNRKEVRNAFNYLSEQLNGPLCDYVTLDSNHYRSFLSCFSRREYQYDLTWNEAVRLHSYLRFYLERGKRNKIEINTRNIKNFPLYGLNVRKDYAYR